MDAAQLLCPRQGEGTPRLASAPRPADTVDIVLDILRNVIINDNLHILHVNAPRRHIRGNQNVGASVPETPHCHISLVLGHVPVQALRLEACPFQDSRKLVHLYLGITENQAEPRLVILQQPYACGILVLSFHLVKPLGNQRNRQLLGRHPYQPGILLELAGYIQYGLGHGCGEQRCLMLSRNLAQNQLHILAEAHVQHLVRLVQHYHIDIIQLYGAPPHVVHDTPRRAHDNLRPLKP